MLSVPPRRPDWHPRLSRYFADMSRRPLVYGHHDCALFAAGAVEAMTGVDPAAEFRGRYDSVAEGMSLLFEAGVERGLQEELDHITFLRLIFDEVPVAFAQVGDVVVVTVPGTNVPALGIVEGQHIAVLRDDGLGFAPREFAVKAYRVP